jgi:hypothetical protein
MKELNYDACCCCYLEALFSNNVFKNEQTAYLFLRLLGRDYISVATAALNKHTGVYETDYIKGVIRWC